MSDQQLILPELENIIFDSLAEADKIQYQARQHEGMLKDMLVNDKAWSAQNNVVENAIAKRKAEKFRVCKADDALDHVYKAKQLRRQARALKAEAGKRMVEYKEKSGSDTIENSEGDLLTIVPTAKLIKTPKK